MALFSLWESNPIFPGKLNISGNVSNGSKNAGKLEKTKLRKKVTSERREREREREETAHCDSSIIGGQARVRGVAEVVVTFLILIELSFTGRIRLLLDSCARQ